MSFCRPLHRRACVVAAVEVDEAQRFLLGEAIFQSERVLAVRRNVVVGVDGIPSHVRHAEFLALVDEGRAAQREENGGERLGRELLVRALGKEVIDGACAVVVLEVDGKPAFLGGGVLARREGALELRERPRTRLVPAFAALVRNEYMAELEEHGEDAVLADPQRQFLGRDAVRLADGEDVVPVEDACAELVQEVEDARRVRRHLVDARHAVRRVRLAVCKDGGLLDVGDGVDAEAADALCEPEVCGGEERLPDLGVLPVEVGLRLGEGVQVVLAALLAVRPRRAAEDAAPVRRGAAVLLRVAPDIPVALRVRAALLRLQEPRVLVGGVVVDEIHDDAHVALLRFGDQLLHVGERAEIGMDAAIVADVVAVVDHGRRVDGREPKRARAERP